MGHHIEEQVYHVHKQFWFFFFWNEVTHAWSIWRNWNVVTELVLHSQYRTWHFDESLKWPISTDSSRIINKPYVGSVGDLCMLINYERDGGEMGIISSSWSCWGKSNKISFVRAWMSNNVWLCVMTVIAWFPGWRSCYTADENVDPQQK